MGSLKQNIKFSVTVRFTSFRKLVELTSLTERFLVRISGSRWKTDRQDVN